MSLAEQWKYEKSYRSSDYRMKGLRLKYAAHDVGTMTPGSLYLDVGCGRGEMLDVAESIGVIACGIETVPDLCDGTRVLHGDICALPFADDAFDYVTCYDVLEHILPGEEQTALDELRRVCRGVVFLSTNDRRSVLPDGTELHVNRRSRVDWHTDIIARWPAAEFSLAEGRDWHWRCQK